jgi:hypothetical protein
MTIIEKYLIGKNAYGSLLLGTAYIAFSDRE